MCLQVEENITHLFTEYWISNEIREYICDVSHSKIIAITKIQRRIFATGIGQ
jgi:hypothetical protein